MPSTNILSRPTLSTGEYQTRKRIMAKAMFGAGCFWSLEETFRAIPGVIDVAVGYSGGVRHNPTYNEVCTSMTGHAEVVAIEFDDNKLSYESLLDVFWDCHDPTQLNFQGRDIGSQYRSVIFSFNEEQAKTAIRKKNRTEQRPTSPRYRYRNLTNEGFLESRGLSSELYRQTPGAFRAPLRLNGEMTQCAVG
jgi:peptide-methionine (S)-S-oxide reductase